ncbi:MAG: hypothetical protein LUH21_04230 [Clostridiales bacterium]|nr:hypothetical protein [Clostridiales bacterium]
MNAINIADIRRHGRTILLGGGITATEGRSEGLPGLVIRRNGKITHEYRGSSLYFSINLTEEDKKYLAALAE